MEDSLSKRAAAVVPELDRPWRFASKATYDPDNNPSGLISFGLAENTLVSWELEQFANQNVTFPLEIFSYGYSTAGGQRFPKALAQHLNECFNPYRPLDGSEIQITDAATSLHDILGWAVGDPGDGILTSRPVYGRFELDFGNKAQLQMVYADTEAETCFDVSVVSKFEEALVRSNAAGVNIRALLIVNPHNPLGRCYPRDTILELMKFCHRHRIHFISDEVYGCTVFTEDGLVGFTSALSVDPAGIINEELCHVTYGLAKDFAAPGLRIGAIITRSKSLHKAVTSVMRFSNPSGASLAIVSAMLQDRQWCRSFLATSRERISEAYKHVTKGLREIGINFLPANAGFFIYIDLSPYLKLDAEDPEFEVAQRLLDQGVFLHPKEEHGKAGWFRVVYTQDPRNVTEGLRRIKSALGL
ncbi:1-aminocyclopropane-1-carboxylate synthase [Pseudomassariella vexata]|uniref:1-aminocyclopropane-1-carboxylate synthase n=1 Tax=Pseudomassariella vexata TaxID=1141098 RepID=A0A1Y2E5I1_9PEZI|nr:1-aminocyclopropane-1-carboxylate synthase [Pseudomassariella vexata]ORY66546.1 1-aminocyclopropane-1-carboxylate synthase [Pseudomassariella vexata]